MGGGGGGGVGPGAGGVCLRDDLVVDAHAHCIVFRNVTTW